MNPFTAQISYVRNKYVKICIYILSCHVGRDGTCRDSLPYIGQGGINRGENCLFFVIEPISKVNFEHSLLLERTTYQS